MKLQQNFDKNNIYAPHTPVLLNEMLKYLNPQDSGRMMWHF